MKINNTKKGDQQMTVIHSLSQKRQEKQIKYELNILKELSLQKIKEKIKEHFIFFFQSRILYQAIVEETCIDHTIEAFLLGAHFSRFGFYGESIEMVHARCSKEIDELTRSLYDYIICWGKSTNDDLVDESIHLTCEIFVHFWWREGYRIGKQRHKLKLI
jgi:hypothetical protein